MAPNPLLSALSPLWALTNAVARVALKGSAERLPKPVISVGNIVAGGVGKTEVTAAIARRLVARGKRVVIATRGYKSKWEKTGAIAFDAEAAQGLSFPDEALVLLRKAKGAAVAVGADRKGVLKKHWEELSPDVVLLDDGYQHFKIARQLDVLVHDFSIKAPVLRDFPIRLMRAPVRIALSPVPQAWQKGPWIQANYRLVGAVSASGVETKLPKQAAAFCGLGNPERFRAALKAAGVDVVAFKTFSDHAPYDIKKARVLGEWHREVRARQGECALLTTLKDYVKLESLVESQGGVAGFEPNWVKLELEFGENENILWKAVDECLAIGAT